MDSAFEDYSMVVTLDGKSVPSWLGIGKVELKRNKLINTRTAFSYALQYAEANHFAAKRTKESVLRQDDDGGMVETSLAQLLETYSLFGVLEQHENNLQAAKECFTKGLRLVFGDDATKVWRKLFFMNNKEWSYALPARKTEQAKSGGPIQHLIRPVHEAGTCSFNGI